MRIGLEDKVSIIVPIYNGEKYLKNTLDAILSSVYKNIEVVLIDDESKDRSKEICKHYVKIDNRVKLFSKINGGIAEARNMGVLKASGKYVCFCDQDDIVEKHMYSDMIKLIKKNKSEVCICSTGRLLNNSKIPYEKLESGLYVKDEILFNILFPILFNGFETPYKNSNVKIYGTIWKYMISRELINNNNLKFKKIVNYEDDLIMSIELLISASKVSTINKVYYFWRYNVESESNKNKYIEDLTEKMKRLDDYVVNIMHSKNIKHEIIEYYKAIKCLDNCCKIIANENYSKKKYNDKKEIFLNYYNERSDYTNDLSINQIENSQITIKLLSNLISRRCYWLAFTMDKVLKRIILLFNNVGILNNIERRMKNIRF